jgi:DNA-binding XRE family transcriptional regulator
LSRGVGVNKAKLDDDKVREIRRLYSEGRTQVALAEQFDVWQTTISQIVRGKTWTHVK